jgi:hypothetical protein
MITATSSVVVVNQVHYDPISYCLLYCFFKHLCRTEVSKAGEQILSKFLRSANSALVNEIDDHANQSVLNLISLDELGWIPNWP